MTVFLENKHTETYFRIIQQAKQKGRGKGKGLALHHIIPAHFYIDNKRKEKEEAKRTQGWLEGNPDDYTNLVYLTHREHLICHLLLRKMVEPEKNAGVIYAAWRMVNYEIEKGVIIKVNSRLYDKIRTEVAETHSKTMKGRTAHNKGKKVTDPEKLAAIKAAANKRLVFFLICPHCGMSVRYPAYYQHHHDNCRQNPNRDPNVKNGSEGSKRSEEWRREHSELLLKHYEENPRGPNSAEHNAAISRGGRGVKKSKKGVENMTVARNKRPDVRKNKKKLVSGLDLFDW